MKNLLSKLQNDVKHWYIPLIIGILFFIFGIYIFSVPLATYITLSIFFSVSFLVSGISDIIFSIGNKNTFSGWGWYLVSGIISTILGFYLISNPAVSMAILPFIVGFTLLFRSAYLLGLAFDNKSNGAGWGTVAISSILGIILSFLLLSSPLFTGLSLVTLTSLTFIFIGISSAMLAFDLKKLKNAPKKISDELRAKLENLEKEISAELKK